MNELTDCLQALETLTAATEDEFLYIGSRLQDFQNRALKISDIARSVSRVTSGDMISQSIEGLNTLIEKMELYLRESHSRSAVGSESLTKLIALMNNVQSQLEGLREIPRALRALGLSTTIQNASLRRPVEDIGSLGKDVIKLSKVIENKTTDIEEKTESLLLITEGNFLRHDRVEAEQKAKGAAVINKTMASVNSLNDIYAMAAKAALDISADSDEIMRNVGDVVKSLQFHDITRQQFEHSKTAFGKIVAALGTGLKDTGISEAETAAQQKGLEELSSFCTEQKDLLKQAGGQFTAAVASIMNDLDFIEKGITRMLGRAEQIIGGEGASSRSFLAAISNALSSVGETLASFTAITTNRKKFLEALTVIVTMTGEMAAFVREIEDIGEEIELIALNSSIMASGIGEEGKALEVIADFVQRISSKTQVYTGEISAKLRATASAASDLSGHVVAHEKADAEVATLLRELEEMLKSLQAANGKAVAAIAKVKEYGRLFSQDIREVIGNITVRSYVGSASDFATPPGWRPKRGRTASFPSTCLPPERPERERQGRLCIRPHEA